MDAKPKVSVIMSVYNAERFLRDAIDSILKQTFTNFEFLIFDDGSTDSSKQIIESYTDTRIKFFNDHINMGYTERFNKGIDIAQGEYIARMDADDISLPTRFAEQVSFLDKHPKTGLVGSSISLIDANNNFKKIKWEFSAPNSEIPVLLLFTNYFAHPSVMYRTDIVRKIHYDQSYIPSEDFKLWSDISDVAGLASIKKTLLLYRVHDKNIGWSMNDKCRLEVMRILAQNVGKLGLTLTKDEIEFHNKLSFDTFSLTSEITEKINNWYLRIFEANNKTHRYSQSSLMYALIGRWKIWSERKDGKAWLFKKTFWSSKILLTNWYNIFIMIPFIFKIISLSIQKIYVKNND